MTVRGALLVGLLGFAALVVLMFLALSEAQGQDFPTPLGNPSQELPDNPLPQSGCSRATVGARGIEYAPVDCAAIPQWRALPEYVTPRPRFWTVGRWDNEKPLRTNREVFRSWTFWGGELANWGSTLALVNVTRNERQNPPIPTHRGLYVDAFVSTVAVSGLHYLSDRYICRGVGLLGIAFASSYRGYEAVKGYYP